MKGCPGVSRVDQPHKRMAGFVARAGFVRLSGGYLPAFSKYFSDKRYGGKQKAKAAAAGWVTTKRRAAARLGAKQRAELVKARAA